MGKVKMQNVEIGLKEKLKNKEFKQLYDFERAKVSLAQKIAELREEKHLRQADLAKRLGVTQQFVSQIETGEENNLTLQTMLKIARSLGRDLSISFPKVSTRRTSYLKVA